MSSIFNYGSIVLDIANFDRAGKCSPQSGRLDTTKSHYYGSFVELEKVLRFF